MHNPLVFVAHSTVLFGFTFWSSSWSLEIALTHLGLSCLIMHSLTSPVLNVWHVPGHGLCPEESEMSKQGKTWVPPSIHSNGRLRWNKIESSFYSFICHVSGKSASIGQWLEEVFPEYFYDQRPTNCNRAPLRHSSRYTVWAPTVCMSEVSLMESLG